MTLASSVILKLYQNIFQGTMTVAIKWHIKTFTASSHCNTAKASQYTLSLSCMNPEEEGDILYVLQTSILDVVVSSTPSIHHPRHSSSPLQHYLTAFGGILSIPLILSEGLCLQHDSLVQSRLINTIFFVSGLCTLLQVIFGVRSESLVHSTTQHPV